MASREHDIALLCAHISIACHNSLCFILFSPLLYQTPYTTGIFSLILEIILSKTIKNMFLLQYVINACYDIMRAAKNLRNSGTFGVLKLPKNKPPILMGGWRLVSTIQFNSEMLSVYNISLQPSVGVFLSFHDI